jgi:hypothetical protein
MNVALPKGLTPGPAEIAVACLGRPIGSAAIEVTPGPGRAPRLVTITDGINLAAGNRVECGALKVLLADIENPGAVSFRIGDIPAAIMAIDLVDPVTEQFCYTVSLPPGIRKGSCSLAICVGLADLPPARLEVAPAA